MKIYLYHQETGLYLGEDFADPPVVEGDTGEVTGTTTIAPPPYRNGECLVFNLHLQRWEVREISVIRDARGESAARGRRAGREAVWPAVSRR